MRKRRKKSSLGKQNRGKPVGVQLLTAGFIIEAFILDRASNSFSHDWES